MVKLWEEFQEIREESSEGLISLESYTWDEKGLTIKVSTMKDEHHTNNYAIHFSVETESFKVDLTTEIAIYNREADYMDKCELGKRYFLCFITDESDMIDHVKELNKYNYSEERRNKIPYLDYIIDAECFWVEVVSSEPPTIEFLGVEKIE